jgi:hypothetical protein
MKLSIIPSLKENLYDCGCCLRFLSYPNDTTKIRISCLKTSHGLDIGKLFVFKLSQEEDADLYYTPLRMFIMKLVLSIENNTILECARIGIKVLRMRMLLLVIHSKSAIKSEKESSILLKETKMKTEDQLM